LVPEDRVFVVDYVDDELTVHIQSASQGSSERNSTGDDDQRPPFTCGHPPDAGTPSFYDGGSYGALFLSLPEQDEGLERVLPIPWPRPEMWDRLIAAVMEGTWVVEELTSPESVTVTLSADVVMFYGPTSDGATKLLIAAREDLEQYLYSTAEQGDPVVTSLAQYSILPTYSRPTTSGAFFVEKDDRFRNIFS
jgi:hypothetical protein